MKIEKPIRAYRSVQLRAKELRQEMTKAEKKLWASSKSPAWQFQVSPPGTDGAFHRGFLLRGLQTNHRD